MNGTDWLEETGDGIVVMDDAGTVSFVNRAAAGMLEVSRDAAIGQPAINVLRDHRLEAAWTERQTVTLQTRQKTLSARGVQAGLIIRDVTAEHAAREEARELLAVLSHELRTPVTTIRSTLEALADAELPETVRTRFLEMAENETARLVRLLQDLTVDVKPPLLRRVRLGEAAGRALALLDERMRARAITADMSGLGDHTVMADTDKLLQCFVNLIENATLHGPAEATIRLRTVVRDDTVRVSVLDEGVPLAPDRIRDLFSPDSRARAGKARGTGLGLYIVNSIASRWGGDAWGKPGDAGNEFGFSVRLAEGPG